MTPAFVSLRPLESISETTGNSVTNGSGGMPVWRGGTNRKWQHNETIDAAIRAGFSRGSITHGAKRIVSCLVAELGWPDKAIRRRAQELKVYEFHSQKGGRPARRRWRATESIDEAIRAAFGKKYERLGCIRNAMKATGWPQHAVIRRAVDLGLTHPRSDIPWTPDEESLLEEFAHQSLPSIQLHLRQIGKHRTQSSIAVKRTRMALLGNMHGMNLRRLAEALGVGELTVRRWLEAGELRAILRFPELQSVGRHVWFFPNEEIRRFILEHMEMIDLARVEKFWFVDLIANGKAPK